MVAPRQHYGDSKATCEAVDSVLTLQEPYLILKYWNLEFPRAHFWALFINDLPLTWKNRNGLFANYATFYASALNLTDVQLQL